MEGTTDSFIHTLNILFHSILRDIGSNLTKELTGFLILSIVFVSLVFLKRKVQGLIRTPREGQRAFYLLIADTFFPVLFLVAVLISKVFLKGSILFAFFDPLAYFYMGFYIIRNLLRYLRVGFFSWILYILLLFAVLSLFIGNLNDLYIKNAQLGSLLLVVLKLSLALLFYVFLFSFIKTGMGFIKHTLLREVLENLTWFFHIVYVVITILWVLRIIDFASSFLIGFIFSILTIAVYALLSTYLGNYVKSRFKEDEYIPLLVNINRFLILCLVFVLYGIFKGFFNVGFIVDYLSSLYLIKTDIISVSVVSIASAIYTFVFLFTLIALLKHGAYFFYIRRNREVEAGSIRAIVSNLGFLLVILISLSKLGLTWKALLPLAGALGIGIGFGLQTIMNNYISGFILLFSKKLKVGDIVEIEGNAGRAIGNTLETIYGRVISIDVLSTVIRTTDGIEIVIPNSQFISQQIVNYSLSDSYIRVRIPFGVSYNSDPNTVREVLLKVAKDSPFVLSNPEPAVWFSEMADSALVFYLLCWVNIRMLWRINPFVSEIYFKGWYELKKAGIEIPFPQRDVWFRNQLRIELEKRPYTLEPHEIRVSDSSASSFEKEKDLD